MTNPLIVKCPTCQKSVEWTIENPYRPFCSEHCRVIDLGAWADESYKVAASDEPLSDDLK